MTATLPATHTSTASAGIPFARLVRVEWRKATDTRAARWLIALTVLGTIAIELAPLLAKNSIDQQVSSYLRFTTFPLTFLLPLVPILTLTTEWTQRTVLTTFVQEPRRPRVIGAKVVVSLLMTVAGVIFGGLVAAVGLAIANGLGRDVGNDLTTSGYVGFALYVLVNIAMAVAFGALLHNTAAAIVLFFVLPIAFSFVGAALDSVGQWIDPGRVFTWVLEGDYGDGHLARVLVTTLLWVVLPLAAGVVRTARREIN